MQFQRLFSPIKIGNMSLSNRIVMLPHRTYFTDPGGEIVSLAQALPGEKHIAYWVARVKGGVSWIATQGQVVDPDLAQDTLRRPEALPRLRKLSDAIHAHGGYVTAQIVNAGAGFSAHPYQLMDLPTPGAPSHIPGYSGGRTPHAMSRNEIKAMAQAFIEGAKILREGGYDGVEIHAASGHFLNTFLCPYMNRRTDEYGGSMENRLRLLLEITDGVRQAVGDDYTVGVRVCADEFFDGGYTLEDMVAMAPIIESKRVDYLSISVGTYRSIHTLIPSMYYPLGAFVYCAAAIKKAVNIPVICAGRINDPVQAEQILEADQADVIGMCRALICDPQWAIKAQQGHLEEIRKCIACNEGCYGRRRDPRGITCALNPEVGKEREWGEIKPPTRRKRVMVVGGGPAGLEAARVAALRGHQVSLYDKRPELGGNLQLAAKAPGRQDFAEVGRYYAHQMKLLGVKVNLDTEVTIETVRWEKPDTVVIATGSVPASLDIPGADGANVVEVKDILAGKVEVGRKVLVVDYEHSIQALTAADLLASQGKDVEFLCDEFTPGYKIDNIDTNIRWPLFQRLFRQRVKISPYTRVREIRGCTVSTVNILTGEERLIEETDAVVYCCGDLENNKLYSELQGKISDLRLIGDAAGPRKLVQATFEGAKVGREI